MNAFELSAVDSVVDIRDKTLDVVVVWTRNEVRDTEVLGLVDCLRRQPDSAAICHSTTVRKFILFRIAIICSNN